MTVIYKPVGKEAPDSKQINPQQQQQRQQQQQLENGDFRVTSLSSYRKGILRCLAGLLAPVLICFAVVILLCFAYMISQRYKLFSEDSPIHHHQQQQQHQQQQHQQQQFFHNNNNYVINNINNDKADVIRSLSESYYRNGNDETLVFKNFKTGYQAVKSRRNGEYVCYISRMAINDQRVTNKISKVYTTSLYEVTDPPKNLTNGVEEFVGQRAADSCSDADVIWVRPIKIEYFNTGTSFPKNWTTPEENDDDPIDNLHSMANYDVNNNKKKKKKNNNNNNNDVEFPRSLREKRNIRSCRSSCCWRVCCCDVHHFVWETAEYFDCSHVCTACSRRYRPIIERVC